MTDTFNAPTLPPGFNLDSRFTVVDVLGIGGFAITYRAFDGTLERHVAIKEHFTPGSWRDRATMQVHTIDVASHRTTTEQFVREGRSIARCVHPSIVKVHQVFEANNTAYLVMELLAGPTLEDRVRSSGPLAVRHASELLGQIGGALQVIHANGLVHQDVSPSNVILTEHEHRAVLIDFGAARNQVAQLSRDLTRIVKPGFSPLEQYGGSPMREASADVYALGATGYFALTGHIPTEATLRFQTDHLAQAAELNRALPPSLSAALHQAMAVNPAQRPTLAQFLSLVASPDRPSTAFPQTVIVPSSGVGPGDHGFASGDQLTHGPSTASNAFASPVNPPNRRTTTLVVGLGTVAALLLGAVIALTLRRPATSVDTQAASAEAVTTEANTRAQGSAPLQPSAASQPTDTGELSDDSTNTVVPFSMDEPTTTVGLSDTATSPVQTTTVGTSRGSQPIELWQTGDGSARVLIVGGLPGDFDAGPGVAREIVNLVSTGTLRRTVTLAAIPDPNPDGRSRSQRENGRGVDLNRNFPSDSFQPSATHGSGPLSEPESKAVADAVMSVRPNLVIALIGTTNAPFVNYDGRGGSYAQLFSRATGYQLKSSGSIQPTPGSLGSWIGVDNNLPMLTVAYPKGASASGGWRSTQAGFEAVLQSL